MDTQHDQQTISDDAGTADGDRQGGRADDPGQVEQPTSRGRQLLKRVAVVLGVVVLVVVIGVAALLAPVVLDRDRPQPAAEPEPLDPTGYVDVGDARLPYLEQGTGPPVLLMHGGGAGLPEFEGVVEALAEDHRAIAYSRRGYEGADAPVPEDGPLPYVDAATVLKELDAEDAIVVGHSSGAGMATRLAQHRPDLVAGVVVLDPALDDEIPLAFVRVAVAVQVRRWFMSDEQAPIPLLRWLLTHDDGFSPWDDHPAFTEEMKYLMLSSAPAPLDELGLLDEAGAEFFPHEGLDQLDVPVTLVVGEQSRPHFHSTVDVLEDEIPGAQRTEIPGAGHGMQLEDPAAVADVIRQTAQAAFDDS